MAVKTVFFDVNQTLTDLRFLEPQMAELGLSPADVDLWFCAVLRDAFALTVTGNSAGFFDVGTDLLAQMIRSQGRSADAGAIARAVMAMAELPAHQDVEQGLRTAHAAGLSLFTLSNGSSAAAEYVLGQLGIRSLVSGCLSVAGEALWKPSREAYEFGVARAGVVAHESVLVAVHPWDVHGARQAGMHAVWVNRDNATYPSYFTPPNAEIPNLVDLADQVRDLGI
jgi:2-haloacid dehalogenase